MTPEQHLRQAADYLGTLQQAHTWRRAVSDAVHAIGHLACTPTKCGSPATMSLIAGLGTKKLSRLKVHAVDAAVAIRIALGEEVPTA